jgi:hypothetical protein
MLLSAAAGLWFDDIAVLWSADVVVSCSSLFLG